MREISLSNANNYLTTIGKKRKVYKDSMNYGGNQEIKLTIIYKIHIDENKISTTIFNNYHSK